MTLKQEVKSFILRNYLFTEDDSALSDDVSLMQQGVTDSTGILELIMHLEDTYAIKVADEDMVPENLDSVQSIVRFVERKRAT